LSVTQPAFDCAVQLQLSPLAVIEIDPPPP